MPPPRNSEPALAASTPSHCRQRARAPVSAASLARRAGPHDVLVIGAGAGARQLYLAALHALEESGAVAVRAIVDPREDARDAWAAAFPAAARVATVDRAVVPPDALAIVAAGGRLRPAQTNAALRRGWHVLCSPPLAPTARDGTLMIAAAARYERLIAADLRTRLFPATRFLRTLCQDHLLGPLLGFRAAIGRPRPPVSGHVDPDKVETPTGALADLGPEILDLLAWFFGDVSVVSYADDAMGGVEANAAIELAVPDRVRGTVHLSRDWPTEDAYAFVFERGIARWPAGRVNGLTLQLASAPSALDGELVAPLAAAGPVSPPAGLLATAEAAGAGVLENVLAAIAGREPLRLPATEALRALALVEECHARRTPLPQPWLSPAEAAHARALSPPVAPRRP